MVRTASDCGLRSILFLMALLQIGCTQDPVAALEACADDDCRLVHIDAAFQQHPESVEQVVRAVSNSISAATLAEHLASQNPEEARAICDWLGPKTVGHQRCRRIYDRPHLIAGEQLKKPGPAPAGTRGPRSADLPRPDWGDPPWLKAAERAAHREGGTCWDTHRGEEPGYSECLFQAAERRARRLKDGELGDVYLLCAASQFAPMCFAHVLQFAAPAPPAADRPDPAAVTRARAVADELTELLASEPGVQAVHLDRYWAVWVYSSFRIADEVTGDLLTLLPSPAHPHIRAAAALRFLAAPANRGLTFHQLVKSVQERLLVRTGAADPADPSTPLVNIRKERWLGVHPLEREIPSTFLMGPGRRASAQDTKVDLQIAVLEAAGQCDPPLPAAFFLGVVGGQESELVRWTGARIGAQLDPAAARGMTDASALVTARLAGKGGP